MDAGGPSSAVDLQRRYFLIGATLVVGAAGVVGAAIPFVGSWNPSARARAAGAPVKMDISRLEPGEMLGPILPWRGKPIFIVNRTPEMLEALKANEATLADPNWERPAVPDTTKPKYAVNEYRSRKPEIGVYIGICTHLGCSPKFQKVVEADKFGGDWKGGGFFCPCHGSRFDLAGRVVKGVPAPDNLPVPPYSFVSDTVIVIGVDEDTKEKA